MLQYQSIAELCAAAQASGTQISHVVLNDQADQMEESSQVLYNRMADRLNVMREAAAAGLAPDLRSTSGLSGGDAAQMEAYSAGGGIIGSFLNHALACAMAVAEYNAAMGKIVAAPTAGSCGIIPGVLLPALEAHLVSERAVIMSLFTAGAVGMVIANRAAIAGAQGGCQAECGSAAAMAATALAELFGGSPEQAAHACAMAIKNQLGLVCDPVAGLVEVPCIKRNAAGVMIAFSSAEMALAGVTSRIPADECIAAMREVGDALPCSLRETAQGGLAATPTGLRIKQQIFGPEA